MILIIVTILTIIEYQNLVGIKNVVFVKAKKDVVCPVVEINVIKHFMLVVVFNIMYSSFLKSLV